MPVPIINLQHDIFNVLPLFFFLILNFLHPCCNQIVDLQFYSETLLFSLSSLFVILQANFHFHFQFGPIQYHTRTVFWNVSPELVRDFFWVDEFRSNWDDKLIYFRTLDVLPQTGTMIVHWIRKVNLCAVTSQVNAFCKTQHSMSNDTKCHSYQCSAAIKNM